MKANNHSIDQLTNIFVILITLIALLLCIFPTLCKATPQFDFENIITLTTGSVGQTRPVAVTWDPLQGEICITDARQAALFVVNSFDIELFKTSTVAGLSYPSDGSVDRQGRLVCVDRGAKGLYTIRRLNVYGEPDPFTPEVPAQDWNPRFLLVTGDGHYITLDPTTALLAKHDHKNGRLIWQRTIALPMEEDLYLGHPIESDDGRLFVPGGNLRQILVLESDGRLHSSFGKFGSAEGYFSFPIAVSFTPGGSLLVLDRMRHKIMVFDHDLQFVSEYGSMGGAPGQFYHPVAMASDSGGRIYVAQGFQGRVQVFRYTDVRP